MKRDEVISILQGRREELSSRYQVTSVSLFGSTARNEAGPESDIDILVDFPTPPSFDQYMGLKIELEDMLGRRVDLVTRRSVSRDWRLYLEDMIECCVKIERYTQGMNLQAFLKTPVVYDAVLRNLEIIGEAAKRIPDETKAQFPEFIHPAPQAIAHSGHRASACSGGGQ